MRYIKTKQHEEFKNYLVDEHGNIYSKLSGFDNGIGYRLYKLTNNDGEKVYQLGHRFTYEAWNEEKIKDGYEIHHKNHIRDDNHIDNLAEVTRSENQRMKKNSK